MCKRLGILAKILVACTIVWMVADFIHSRLMAHWMNRWEASVEWDEYGVRQGCSAYSVGQGNTALLLVHGINSSPRCYESMAAHLADQGFTCRVMRLPGFAEHRPSYAKTTAEQWMSSIDLEVRQLRTSHKRVGIVAHSLGGAAAIGYALRNPDAVDGVALLAPAVDVANDRSPLLSARAWHELGQSTLIFTRSTWSPFGLDCHDPTKRDFPGRSPYTPLSVIDELFELMDENRQHVDEFQTPLLMVVSRQDKVIDWQAAQEFYEQTAVTEKSIRVLSNCGHALVFDYEWETVADEIADFFSQ